MEVLKTAVCWCNSPDMAVLATPQLISTTRLIWFQTVTKVWKPMNLVWFVVMLKGRMISVHNSHSRPACPDGMCKACTVFEYLEVEPNVYFSCSPDSCTPQCGVSGFSCGVWLSLSIWVSVVSFTNLPLDPAVSQLNPVHTRILPFIIFILPCVHRCAFHVFHLKFWCFSNIHHPFWPSSVSRCPWFDNPRNNQGRVQIMDNFVHNGQEG